MDPEYLKHENQSSGMCSTVFKNIHFLTDSILALLYALLFEFEVELID